MSCKKSYLSKILAVVWILAAAAPAIAAGKCYDPLLQLRFKDLPLNPYHTPPNRFSSQEEAWPEDSINQVVDYGLSLILPQFVRTGLELDALRPVGRDAHGERRLFPVAEGLA